MRLKFRHQLTADQDGAALFGLARLTRHPRHGFTLEINPRRLLALFAILVVLGYIVVVGAAYAVRSQRPYNQVTLADIALPWNWPGISAKAGQTNLEHGKALFEQKKYRDALHLLRAGLRRAPADHQARLYLAQLYHGAQQSEAATNILARGLDYGYPEDTRYVDLLLYMLAMREDYEEIATIAQTLRGFPEVQADPERWQALSELEIKTLKKRRDFQRILDYAREMSAREPGDTRYTDLEVLALIKLGFIDDAEARMAAFPVGRQYTATWVYLQAVIALETGDFDTFDTLTEKLMRWPTAPRTLQSQLILELDLAGQTRRRDALLREYVAGIEGQTNAISSAILLFDGFLEADTIDRLIASMNETDSQRAQDLQLRAIFARIRAGDISRAQDRYAAWRRDIEINEEQAEELAWIDALLNALSEQGQDSRKVLWDLTRQHRFPVLAYTISAQALLRARDWETAERVAENGLHFFPHDPQLAHLRQSAAAQR